MNARSSWDLVKGTFEEWNNDKASRLAAALAYYTAFSLAPLLVIAIGIAGLVFGDQAAQGEIVAQLEDVIGREGAKLLEQMIAASRTHSEGVAATVIGIAVLLFGASGVFGQLQDALDTIWEVQPRPGRGLRGILRDRFLSFTMVLGTGFLLLVSLVLSAAFAAAGGYVGAALSIPEAALQIFNALLSLALTTLLFALIFKVVPDAKVAWRDVWIGAAVTALLFTAGKLGIGLYLGKSSVASSFGAAASLAVLLVWIYYSAQILFLGAEFTQVYATRFGSHIQPARGAVPLTDEQRAEQGAPRTEPGEARPQSRAEPRPEPPKEPRPGRREEPRSGRRIGPATRGARG